MPYPHTVSGNARDQFIERMTGYQRDYGQFVYSRWNAPPGAIFIGRPTVYGNPFPAVKGDLESRICSCEDFYWYLVNDFRNGHIAIPREELLKLVGMNVACHCSDGDTAPNYQKFCHGHILVAAAHSLILPK